jgi:transketolase
MNNILIGALLFFICSTGIFGYISYDLSEQKGAAVQALHEAQDRLADSEKSLNLQIKSCEISDSVTSEYQAEKQVMQGKVQDTVSKIDSLPKKAPQVNQDAEIDIDSKLPVDLQRMLSEAINSHQGSSANDAR